MGRPITFDEATRIKYLRKQGWSYHRIGRDLGRNPAAVLRICTGERGALRKTKAWRCGGCGAMICKPKCLACETNQRLYLKKRNTNAAHWSSVINEQARAKKDAKRFL